MKKIYAFIFSIFMIFTLVNLINAQEKQGQKYKLSSERLDNQGKELDREILNLSTKIASVIKKYDLLNTKDIRIVPYQTSYDLGKDYIKLEKHQFIRSQIYKNNVAGIKDVVGIRTKGIKIYTDGKTVSKIETRIYEKYYNTDDRNEVIIIDPSPLTAGTDDVIFSHHYKNKKLLDKKKLGDVKNTTAYPVRNDLKRSFLVPNLNIFYNSLIFVAEAYYKSLKDADTNMAEFLKNAVKYE